MGEVRIISDDNGVRISAADGTYDFGAVNMGTTQKLTLTVQNTGTVAVTLQSFAKDSGDAVAIGQLLVEPNAVFTVDFTSTDVPPGETRDFELTFAPPLDSTQKIVDHLTVLKLQSAPTEAGKNLATITLKGRGVSGECDLPATIDFGAIARTDTASSPVIFKNARPIDTVAFISAIDSPQGASVFGLTPDSPRDEFTLLANRQKTATFTFSPTEARDYFATVTMRAAQGCPDRRVRLIGTGVDQLLTWAPASVEFGYVTPALSVTKLVTFSNLGFAPAHLKTLQVNEMGAKSPNFKVILTDSADLTALTVPGATRDASNTIVPGQASLTVAFKPTLLGARSGALVAQTDLRTQSTISVPTRGTGGGPDIDVKPITFGRIAYFQGSSPASFASRKLTIQNVGTRPNPPDPQANLKLGPQGVGGAGKYWSVVAKNANSDTSELCVGTFTEATGTCTNDLPATGAGRYDPTVGLEASANNAILDIPVRITPASLGLKAFEITLYSNDPDEPAVTVSVSAEAVVLPPCSLTVSPVTLNFGIVTPPLTRDLAFSVHNTGSESCFITNLTLTPEVGTPTGMPAVFSLPAGDIAERELLAGETMQVIARAWPQGLLPAIPAAITGHVQFNVSNPTMPQAQVTLTTTIGTTCLTVSPADLDFGTVAKDCSSSDRTFFIYNTCTQAVTINSSQLATVAGQSAEFFVTAAVPANTVVAAGSAIPPSFVLKYHPVDYGPDTASYVLHVTQSGQALDYVVTLRGRGDEFGLNTDTFRQDLQPKADILLVIDDSGSMADKQLQLGQNLNAFLQYARASKVDFNLAVTNTELTDPTLGDFRTSPGGYKILTPVTPNLDQEFARLVQTGLTGGTETCLEGARRALTAPKIVSGNTGFLRPDAFLAVVCVSDAGDQGPLTTATYLNQFLAIKGVQKASKFSFSDIGPYLDVPPVTCTYDPDHNPASYLAMVTQSHGVKEEICTPDWATALENVGKSAFGFRTNFYLTATPNLLSPRGIEVGIDAQSCDLSTPCPMNQVCSTFTAKCTVPQVDSHGAAIWHFDSATNSVNFEPLYVPEPGKTLTVSYQVACGT